MQYENCSLILSQKACDDLSGSYEFFVTRRRIFRRSVPDFVATFLGDNSNGLERLTQKSWILFIQDLLACIFVLQIWPVFHATIYLQRR